MPANRNRIGADFARDLKWQSFAQMARANIRDYDALKFRVDISEEPIEE
jgi:hypothetical protein